MFLVQLSLSPALTGQLTQMTKKKKKNTSSGVQPRRKLGFWDICLWNLGFYPNTGGGELTVSITGFRVLSGQNVRFERLNLIKSSLNLFWLTSDSRASSLDITPTFIHQLLFLFFVSSSPCNSFHLSPSVPSFFLLLTRSPGLTRGSCLVPSLCSRL